MKLRELVQQNPFTSAINRSVEPAILVLNLGSGYGIYQVQPVVNQLPQLAEVHSSVDLAGVEAYLQYLPLNRDAWVATG